MKRLIAIAALLGFIAFGASSCAGAQCGYPGGNPNDCTGGWGAAHHHHAILTSAQR